MEVQGEYVESFIEKENFKDGPCQSQSQVCVNCSQPLPLTFTCPNREENKFLHVSTGTEDIDIDFDCNYSTISISTSKTGDKFERGGVQIGEILSSIYKLHYLEPCPQDYEKTLNDNDFVYTKSPKSELVPEFLKGPICLCPNCAQVLTNLYKYYHEFNQLRKVDSFLANKINLLDEIFREYHQNQAQKQNRPKARSLSDHGEVETVIKCEVVAEEGNEEIIFDDDHDDSYNNYEEHGDYGNDVHFGDLDNTADIGIFNHDRHHGHGPGKTLKAKPNLKDKDEFNDFAPNSDIDANAKNTDANIEPIPRNESDVNLLSNSTSTSTLIYKSRPGPKSSKIIVIPSKGPWVKLNRLKNVRVGSPVHVSDLNLGLPPTSGSRLRSKAKAVKEADRNSRDFENLVIETGRKIKSNYQTDEIFLDSSEPSDNDDSGDSDFFVEYDSRISRGKRKQTRRSSRKSTFRNTNRTDSTSSCGIKSWNSVVEYNHQTFDDNSATNTSASLQFGDNIGDQDSDQDGDESESRSRSDSSCSSVYKPDTKKRKSASKKSIKSKVSTAATKVSSGTKKKSKSKRGPKTKYENSAATKERKKEEKKIRDRIDKGYRRRKVREPNPCWHCPLNFPTQEECREHAKATHYKDGDYFCSKCSRVCHNKNSFSQHQNICEQLCPGEKLAPYGCPHCPKVFAFKNYLTTHLLVHRTERDVSCSKCDFKAKSALLVKNHFNRMHVDHPKFKYKRGPNGELNAIAEPIIYKCDHCENTFKNDHSRRIHMVKLHTEEGFKKYRQQQRVILDRQREERKIRLAKKSYVCPECNIDFFSNQRLLCHRKSMHIVEKKFVCDQCGKDFSRAASLRYHITYAHSDNRPFICEHCGKAFKTVYNLKDHVNHTHSEEGRLHYNQLMRRHNQRRKIVAAALAKKTMQSQGNTSSDVNNYDLSQMRNVPIDYGHRHSEATAAVTSSSSSSSTSSFYPESSGQGPIHKFVENWSSIPANVNPTGSGTQNIVTTNSMGSAAAAHMLDLLMPQMPQ